MADETKSLADFGASPDEPEKPKKKKKASVPAGSKRIMDDLETAAAVTKFESEGLLTTKEKRFYNERRATYLKEFNLNKSSDIGLIHRIIMEEIITERLYEEMLRNPLKDLSDQISASADRYRKGLESLGASRDKRIKNRETNSVSIADVAREYFQFGGKAKYDEGEDARIAEERGLEAKKQHQLELEYGSLAIAAEVSEEEPDGEA